MIRARLARFLADEDGAVTADWLALTAAVVVLGALGIHIIAQGATSASDELASALQEAGVPQLHFETTTAGATSTHASGVGAIMP